MGCVTGKDMGEHLYRPQDYDCQYEHPYEYGAFGQPGYQPSAQPDFGQLVFCPTADDEPSFGPGAQSHSEFEGCRPARGIAVDTLRDIF